MVIPCWMEPGKRDRCPGADSAGGRRAVQPGAAGDEAGVDQYFFSFLFPAAEEGLVLLEVVDQRAPQVDGAGQAVAVVGGLHDADLGVDGFYLAHHVFIALSVDGRWLVGNMLQPAAGEAVLFGKGLDQADDLGDVFLPFLREVAVFGEVDHQFRAAPVVAVAPVKEVGGLEIPETVSLPGS